MPSRHRTIQVGCGVGNRLFSMANEMNVYKDDNFTFVWAPDVNKYVDESHSGRPTSFDDLFSYPESAWWRVKTWGAVGTTEIEYLIRTPEVQWFPHLADYNVTRTKTIIGYLHGYVKDGAASACCVCPRTSTCCPGVCTPWLRALRPAASLQPALERLRERLGPSPKMLHLRNADPHARSTNFDNANATLTPSRVHALLRKKNISYAAVEHRDDARLLRQLSPTTMMQQDFRQVTYGRASVNAHRTSVFDLFALSMVNDFNDDVTSTSPHSSFLQLTRCLRMQS